MEILHVDDEEDIRAITQMSLELDGHFDVVSVGSGALALERLADDTPDLILLDVMMPGMSGPDLRDILARDDRMSAIPVIFMTAAARPEAIHDLLAIGAVGVIEKPFDPLALAGQIRAIMADQTLPSDTVVA